MAKLTFAHYLTQALKELDPPSKWEDIVQFVLITLNCTRRQRYFTEQLGKALDVGLRFGIIRERNNKYYLYEYAKVSARGKITYKLGQYPRSVEWEEMKEDMEEEQKQELAEVKCTKRKRVKSIKEERKSTKKQCRN